MSNKTYKTVEECVFFGQQKIYIANNSNISKLIIYAIVYKHTLMYLQFKIVIS